MKTLSLIGILISILGIILSFAVIDNHINFYNTLHDALGISFEDFESDTPKIEYIKRLLPWKMEQIYVSF